MAQLLYPGRHIVLYPARIYNDESIQQKRKKTHENKKGLNPA